MRILCAVENEEMQGWAIEFARTGHTFSFYDGSGPLSHICHIFKPDVILVNNYLLNKSIQNACAKHKVVILNIDKYRSRIPICANTNLYNKYPASQHNDTIAIFGDPTDKNVLLANQIGQHHKIKIFNQKKWPLEQYCGFLNQSEFLHVTNTSKACVVLSETPQVRHYNVCASGGRLLHNCDLDIGEYISDTKDIRIIDDMMFQYEAIADHQHVLEYNSTKQIPSLISEIYEEENFFFS